MTEFRHAGIVVQDLERSLHFYCDLLGLKVLRAMEEEGAYLDNMLGMKGVRVTTVKLTGDQGGAGLELLYFHAPRTPVAPVRGLVELGPSHVAFTVADLDATFARLTAAGVQFNAPPQLAPDGLAKVTFCRDPDGTPIELVEMLEVSC